MAEPRADKVQFELVSPEKLLLSEPVDMVVVPGGEGNFGVLIGHAPLISTVRPGVIDVYEGTKITERIFVAGGFAEVTPERCTVLADEAMPLSDLDKASIDGELRGFEGTAATLRDQVARPSGSEHDEAAAELVAIEKRIAVCNAKLQALSQGAAH